MCCENETIDVCKALKTGSDEHHVEAYDQITLPSLSFLIHSCLHAPSLRIGPSCCLHLAGSSLNTKVQPLHGLLAQYLLCPLYSLPIHVLLILVPPAVVPGFLSWTPSFLCHGHFSSPFHPWHMALSSTWCLCPTVNMVHVAATSQPLLVTRLLCPW